jgi:hypothetical protein
MVQREEEGGIAASDISGRPQIGQTSSLRANALLVLCAGTLFAQLTGQIRSVSDAGPKEGFTWP